MQKRNSSVWRGWLLLCVTPCCAALLLTGCGSSSSRSLGSNLPPGAGGTPPLPPPGGGGFPPPPDPPLSNVTVSGLVTFDLVPFDPVLGAGLDFASMQPAPARGLTVEAVSAINNSLLAVTQTDAVGAYSLSLLPNAEVFLRVKAQMTRSGTPSWTVRVRDNTSGDALYALDSTAFNTGTGTALTRDLHAASGWDTTSGSYPDPALQAAAPFAILDVLYVANALVVAAEPAAVLPPLDIYWSPNNRPADGVGDPAIDFPNGDIGTTFFETGVPAKIYVLGAQNDDTDEFDRHVISHEWGHYYQDAFSRDDSIGGDHDFIDLLDLRVAFSEGWADAFSGMASGDPLYRDSFDLGQSADFGMDLELEDLGADAGWFSEGSIALVLYDLYDSANDGVDTVELGFAPLHSAMGQLASTDALTAIHPYINALVPLLDAGQASVFGDLLVAQGIEPVPTDDFAANELNNGGSDVALPLYTNIALGGSQVVCSRGSAATQYNLLGNRRFLRFELATSQTVTIAVQGTGGTPATNPDVVLHHQGVVLGLSETSGASSIEGVELEAGTYVIETYHFQAPRRCTLVSASVTP